METSESTANTATDTAARPALGDKPLFDIIQFALGKHRTAEQDMMRKLVTEFPDAMLVKSYNEALERTAPERREELLNLLVRSSTIAATRDLLEKLAQVETTRAFHAYIQALPEEYPLMQLSQLGLVTAQETLGMEFFLRLLKQGEDIAPFAG